MNGEHASEIASWSCILVSKPITKTAIYIDSSIYVSFDWKDQGWGNRKGGMRIILIDDAERIVAEKHYRRVEHDWTTEGDTINSDHNLIG